MRIFNSKIQIDGASHTVAVVLMVGLVVIMAAIIGTVLLDTTGTTESTPAGVEFSEDKDAGTVSVRLIDGGSSEFVRVYTEDSEYELTEPGEQVIVSATDSIKVIGVSDSGSETFLSDYEPDSETIANAPASEDSYNVNFITSSDSEWASGQLTNTQVGSLLLSNPRYSNGDLVPVWGSPDTGGVREHGDSITDIGYTENHIITVSSTHVVVQDLDGVVIWTKELSNRATDVEVSPDGQYAYVSHQTRSYPIVQKYDITDGTVLWTQDMGDKPLALEVSSDGDVFVSTYGTLSKLTPTDGSTVWEKTGLGDETPMDIDSDGDVVLIGGSYGHINKLVDEGTSATFKWSMKPRSDVNDIVLTDSAFYVSDFDHVDKYDRSFQTREWTFKPNDGSAFRNVHVDDGKVFAPSHNHGLFILDPSDGTELNFYEGYMGYSSGAAVGPNGEIYSAVSQFLVRVNEQYEGDYVSKQFSTGETVRWEEIEINISSLDPDARHKVDLTVHGSNDSFATSKLIAAPTYTSSGEHTIPKSDIESLLSDTGVKYEMGSYGYGAAIGSDGTYFTSNTNGEVVALEKSDTGFTNKWTNTDHTDEVYALTTDSSRNVYAGGCDQSVSKIDSTGAVSWNTTVLADGCVYDIEKHNGYLYVAGAWNSDKIHKLDASTGQQVDSIAHASVVDITIHDGKLYSVGAGGDSTARRYSLDTLSEDSSFRFEVDSALGNAGEAYSVSVDNSGDVYIGASWSDPHIVKIDSTGNKVWQTSASGLPYTLVEKNGILYTLEGNGGTIQLIKTSDGSSIQEITDNESSWVQQMVLNPEGGVFYTTGAGDAILRNTSSSESQSIAFRISLSSVGDAETSTPVIESVRISGTASQDSGE